MTPPDAERPTPSPGTPGEGGGGGLPTTGQLVGRQTPSLTLPRRTGRGDKRPAALVLLLLAGCAAKPDPIPRYALAATTADSLDLLRSRLANLKTVRGEATITLVDAKGGSVRLDAAYVLAPPGRARLRAWKFGQAVFDLTIDGDRAWAYLPREEAKPAAPGLRQSLGRWLGLLGGGGHAFDGLAVVLGDDIMIERPEGTDATLRIRIDRATLTPRRYTVFNRERWFFELTLADYRQVGDGQVWPMTIVATQYGPARGASTGVVDVRTHDVEVNADLDAAVFTPPARAEELP